MDKTCVVQSLFVHPDHIHDWIREYLKLSICLVLAENIGIMYNFFSCRSSGKLGPSFALQITLNGSHQTKKNFSVCSLVFQAESYHMTVVVIILVNIFT